MMEKLLNHSTILENIQIYIDDFEILSDEFVSLEMKNNFFNLDISGTLKIKDSFDVFNSGKVKFINKNKITIHLTDFLKKKIKRVFYITGVNSNQHNERFKILDIFFIDEITYLMSTSYLSKSFNASSVSALSACLDNLNIDEVLENSKVEKNFSDSGVVQTFAVTRDKSILEFFYNRLKKENIRIWQDIDNFYIKEFSLSELSVKQLDNKDILYSNRTLNNSYVFKIHDYEELNYQNYESNLTEPNETIYNYSGSKAIEKINKKLSDNFSSIKLNTLDNSMIQSTDYEKLNSRTNYNQKENMFDLFNSYITNNQLKIVVPGSLEFNNVGFIVDIELKGNPIYSNTSHENDVYSSGKYFVSGVSNRIVGNKFLQRLTLNRLDPKTPRLY